MPSSEKIVIRTAALLFVGAAVLEILSRLRHLPHLHDIARWVAAAALFVVFIPLVVVAVVLIYQAFFGRAKSPNGS